jgi:hypothetical protein
MSEAPLPGPLDEFLSHPPAAPASAGLRQDLLRQTSGLVRRRRLVRRLAAAGAVAAAVLLTAAALWYGLSGGQPPEPPPVAKLPERKQPEPAPAPPQPVAVPAPEKPKPAPAPEAKAPPSAVALEWKAFDAPRPQKAALYLKAGDRYLADGHDIAAALRCYGQAFKTAPPEALEVTPDDNWLLIALKMDHAERRKEN